MCLTEEAAAATLAPPITSSSPPSTASSTSSNSPPTSQSSPESPAYIGGIVNPAVRQELAAIWRCYVHLMDEIQAVTQTLGKDGKFQLFICLSLR